MLSNAKWCLLVMKAEYFIDGVKLEHVNKEKDLEL